MPAPPEILAALAGLAQRWQELAMAWHAYIVALGLAAGFGWRPANRVAALLLLAPLASAAALAGLSGNPFNAAVLGAATVGLATLAWRVPAARLALSSPGNVLAGMLLVVFGLVYPHFLAPASLLTYLHSAPVGIVPCPTLAVITGASLATGSFGSRAWSVLLGAVATFYGLFGALRLGVALDWTLLFGVALLLFSAWRASSAREARTEC